MSLRTVNFDTIVQTVEKLCTDAAYNLGDDVLDALKNARLKESIPRAQAILDELIENAQIAKDDLIPLCQDTGLAVVFVEQGSDTFIAAPAGKTIEDAINLGVSEAYEKAYLRKSVVTEPLHNRLNTKTNTPAIIHHSFVSGDKIKISIMAKGGGCENKCQFKMFNPTATVSQVVGWIVKVVIEAGANACPPFVVGVGIGGNFEKSCILSKQALLRKMGQSNPDKFYADMEKEIFEKVNASGLGPQGLGGDTTALGCFVEFAPCHIASLPAAVTIECHSHRHKSAII